MQNHESTEPAGLLAASPPPPTIALTADEIISPPFPSPHPQPLHLS